MDDKPAPISTPDVFGETFNNTFFKSSIQAADALVESVVAGITDTEAFYKHFSREAATAVLLAHIIIALENGQTPLITIDALRVGIRWSSLQEKVDALSKIDTPAAERAAGRLQDILKDSSQEYYQLITILLRESPRLQSWDESKGFPLCQ